MEHRGCGGEMNRARRMYHSGETTDLAFVVRTMHERFGPSRLFAVGVSLSGNQIAKWLGEEGEAAAELLDAASVISPPFDLVVSGPVLDRRLFGLYTRNFLRTLVPKARPRRLRAWLAVANAALGGGGDGEVSEGYRREERRPRSA